MCGIIVVLRSSAEIEALRTKVLSSTKLIRHRGPDWSGTAVQQTADGKHNFHAHERLAIVGV